MASIIEQYTQEIDDLTVELAVEKESLKTYQALKRDARPSAMGRIANDNWEARLAAAQYGAQIAACKANIALLTNQIKLKKEAIAKEKSAKTPAKSIGKTVAKSPKPAAKKPIKKATPATKVKKNADGTVDKRTKEGKAIAERMAKARAAQKKSSTKKNK